MKLDKSILNTGIKKNSGYCNVRLKVKKFEDSIDQMAQKIENKKPKATFLSFLFSAKRYIQAFEPETEKKNINLIFIPDSLKNSKFNLIF